jgi:hypothetical protein
VLSPQRVAECRIPAMRQLLKPWYICLAIPPVVGFVASVVLVGCLGQQPPQPKMSGVLKGLDGTVLSVAFSPDGKALCVGREDGTIILLDMTTGKPFATLKAELGNGTDVRRKAQWRIMLCQRRNLPSGTRPWRILANSVVSRIQPLQHRVCDMVISHCRK